MSKKTPFGTILKWLDVTVQQFSDESKLDFNNVKNYSAGRSVAPVNPFERESFYRTIIKLLEENKDSKLSCDNYRQITTQFIINLSTTPPTHYGEFCYNDYLSLIEKEDLPKDDDEFLRYKYTSCFYDFLIAYVNWKRPIKQAEKESVAKREDEENGFAPISSDHSEPYMPQSLTDADGNTVIVNDPDNPDSLQSNLLYLDKHKLVLITGPGGQGKSTFLKMVQLMNHRCKTFDKVILIPLVSLTSINMDYRSDKYNIITDYILHQDSGVRFDDAKQKILILLDGFNEYRTSKNHRAVDNITGSLTELVDRILTRGKDGSESLVITTRDLHTTVNIFPAFQRFQALTLSGTSDSEYQLIRSVCESKGVDFDGTELAKLAETPLYALMIKRLIEEGNAMEIEDQFSLLDKVYQTRAEQRIGNNSEKSIYPKSDYLYFYYVILPYFSYRVVTSTDSENTYCFRRNQVHGFLSEIRQKDLDRLIFTHLQESKRFRYIDGECPHIEAQKLMEFLDSEEDFIVDDNISGEYSFKHEQWRNYLAAIFLKVNAELLQKHYTDPDDSSTVSAVMTDLNVDADISKMLLQSMNLFGGKKENAAKMKELFRLDEQFYNHLDGAIRLLHLGYAFNDYLQVDLPIGENGENETVHKILLPLSNYLLSNAGNERLISRIRNNHEIVRCTCYLLSKETEYYRRTKDYRKVFDIIALCKKLDEESLMIRLHEAKLYLCYFESVMLNDTILSIPEEFKTLSDEQIRNKGFTLLDAVADRDFFFAVNLKGLIQTNPAPYLIRNSVVTEPDYCGTFCHYIRMISDSEYVRRDTAYTIHQALRLLVEYVTIDEDSAYNPFDCNSDPAMLKVVRKQRWFSPINGEKDLAMAKYLLQKCSGQALAGLNYLRGYATLASSDKNAAQAFFESTLDGEWKLPYHLMLKYCYGKDHFDIDSEYMELIEKITKYPIGRLDKTHPIYRYIEAKSIELNLIDGSKAEARNEEFVQLERDSHIDSLVKSITDYLTQ